MSEPGTDLPASEEYRCRYCGHSLDLRYYFCIHCASPYREPDETIYGVEPPPAPTFERRVIEDARPAWQLTAVTGVVVLFWGVFGAAADLNTEPTWWFLQSFSVAAVAMVFLVLSWEDVGYLFSSFHPSPLLLLSLPCLAGMLTLNYAYIEFLQGLLEVESIGLGEMYGTKTTAFLIVVVCVFPGIFEEIGFRGVAQERLVRAVGFWRGAAISSSFFTALHFSILSAPYLFCLSMFFCCVRERSKSIYPTMVLHFLHNYVVIFHFTE